jgi:hypothetical protein
LESVNGEKDFLTENAERMFNWLASASFPLEIFGKTFTAPGAFWHDEYIEAKDS